MKWFESLVVYLFPTILLEGKPWKAMWLEKELDAFVRTCRPFFLAAASGYVAHYFFYDRPMGLEPLEQWFTFRMIAAAVSLAAFSFYLTPLAYWRINKLPAIAAIWVYCYTQAMVTTWWDGTPWLFSFFFVVGSILVLRLSPLNSLALASMIIATQTPFHLEAGVPLSSVVSTSFVALLAIVILKASHVAEVRNFVLNQENISAQKKIIELNIEFTDRLRAFIPRVIADRLENLVKQDRLTVIQATVEVLTPRRTNVACLFSDIRGYTQGSKDLDHFISKSVLPEMKACSNAVEQFGGIPRKVGDLIFAYFDDQELNTNVVRCLVAGAEISRINRELNDTTNQSEIKRYILIASGEAIVGNLGGLDSSIEITALGPPVNFLSRLDELTKHVELSSKLTAGDILICANTARAIERSNLCLDLEEIDIKALSMTIRDFPETTKIFRLENSSANFERLIRHYHASHTLDFEHVDSRDLRLAG